MKSRSNNCPLGIDSISWYKWCVAEAAGTIENFEHSPAFHPNMQKNLLPIYEELSRKNLLERCLSAHTQNANKSFNSTCVWRLTPKHLNCGFKTIEIVAFIAVSVFNENYSSIL